jgi:hypothetical protein
MQRECPTHPTGRIDGHARTPLATASIPGLSHITFNLKTAVGCICQRRCWGAGRGATTRQARACKEKQHRMALQQRCWQVHSAVSPKVGLRKQPKARVHAVCGKMTSGQLPFLASTCATQAALPVGAAKPSGTLAIAATINGQPMAA